MDTLHNAKELEQELSQFCGSTSLFKLSLFNTYYTEGIAHLVEKAKCHWFLIDASAKAKLLAKKYDFITVKLKMLSKQEQAKTGYMLAIDFTDGNENVINTITYSYSDFPLQEIELYFINNTLLLPSEY